MSIIKIIIITIVTGIVLFILMLVYALWPKIRDVSRDKGLSPFLNKPLTLKRMAVLYFGKDAEYRFKNYSINERYELPHEKEYGLAAGHSITLKNFKTYTNSAGSGFTYLYGLGETTLPSGEKVEFEYDWGSVDESIYGREVVELPLAPWQDSTETKIKFRYNK